MSEPQLPPWYFELRFQPNTQLVSVVRRFISSFYERVLNDPDATSRLALATHELLENAVKYASNGETFICIKVTQEKPRHVTVSTTNRAAPEHLRLATEVLDAIRASDDPMAFYAQTMRAATKRDTGSGLGLARICAEAEMSVSWTVQGDDLLIAAEMVVP
jgi:hypothetical protein